MPAWASGIQIGPYVLLAPIGAGGMGEVWKARDTRLGRIVAIKRLKSHHGTRFEQEARAIAALNHPHICQIHDIGPDYLVLEYIEGQALLSQAKPGPVAADEAVRLAVQIAEALDAAHRKGVVHRDLKPANIMVTSEGSVKLLDFGLAKQVGDSDETATFEGTVMGTAAYMAPEQTEGKPLDARSDVFSFGAVLYELLSGRRAFRGENSISTMAAILHKEPAPLDAPAALEQIVKRCLAKPPEQRYQTMAEVKAALGEIRQGTAPGRGSFRLPHTEPSIAVLPFANMSGDREQEYFSDGLAEEIINALVKIPGLKVIARTSAFAFKGQNTDIRKIAETLGVANVLEGSVRRSGNRIRVTAQLITAADGSHLWSERYDRELADVFAVQDEISAAIAGALHTKLSPQPAAKPRYTPKLPAYEAYLKARHYHWKLTPDAMAQAKEFYEQAIALDPQFALAQALYADLFFLRASASMMPAHEALPAARAMAQRALELDASLPDPHAILCAVAAAYDYDWKEAERRFTMATAKDAASPWILSFLGAIYFLALGRRKEAIEHLERAVQGDPLHPVFRAVMAICLGADGRYAEAEAHLRQILDLDPNYALAYTGLANIYAVRRMFVEALPFAEKAYSLAPWNAFAKGLYAGLLIRNGEPGRGKELAQELGSGQVYGTSFGLANFHVVCGEIDLAADWVEKAIEERNPGVAYWLQSAIGKPLRTSPRWPKLAALLNLPEAGS